MVKPMVKLKQYFEAQDQEREEKDTGHHLDVKNQPVEQKVEEHAQGCE
jgi:hypothetical protein